MADHSASPPALYWSCWLCCAPGGYDHNSDYSYAGDVSKLLLADRQFLEHKLRSAYSEILELARTEGHAVEGGSDKGLSLKDLVRGQGVEHLRGCVSGFAIVKMHSFFEDVLQSLGPEAGVTHLGISERCLCLNCLCLMILFTRGHPACFSGPSPG